MLLLYYAFVLLLLVCSSAAQSIGDSGTVSSNPPGKTVLLANITRECGVAKGCLLYPLGCIANKSNCVYVATWRAVINTTADDNIAEFELWTLKSNNNGLTTHWSSLALSDDEILGSDDVLACLNKGADNLAPKDLYNPPIDAGVTRQDTGEVDVRLVQTYATSEYIYCQFTRSFTGTSPPEQDRDLGVPQFLYFARGARYNATSLIVTNQDILGVSPRKERVVDYVVVPIQYPDLTLIKVHGSFMIFTFLFLIPIGIILSTFYKIVWPNGGWFFAHIVVMLLALVCTLVGFITIFEHARNGGQPRFIVSTNIGIAHGVFGIIAFSFLCINPIVGMAKGDPNNKWRKYFFKPIHGSIGLLFVTTIGMTNLVLGLNRVAAFISEADFWIIRGAIYFCSGTIGCILAVMSLFNVYHVMFHKRVLDPNASVQLQEDDLTKVKFKDEYIIEKKKNIVLKPSRDYIPRTIFLGVYIIGLLILTGIVLGLFNYIPQRTPTVKLPGFTGFV